MLTVIERVLGKAAIIQRLPEQPGDVRTTYEDVCKAQRDLGFAPTVSFEEGIR